jgi:C_GCAxxG_C_C family probable redox protein
VAAVNDPSFRMVELAIDGFGCSQILVQVALEAQGKSNPELVRAMSGLLNGMGCGRVCGALTGGCCVLGLYAGRGAQQEHADAQLDTMLHQFLNWFEVTLAGRYGSVECETIVGDDPRLRMERCPQIVSESLAKVAEILASNSYPLAGPCSSWAAGAE